MRDGPRGRERLEITLDARELVSIALGLVVVLGLVFYLGVTVGKDLKPAALAADTSLEALDARAEASPLEKELTFAEVLTEPGQREGGPAEDADNAAEKAAPREAPQAEAPAKKAEAAKKAEPEPAAGQQAALVAPVEVAAGKGGEREAAAQAAPEAAESKVYSVQVGSFPQRGEAEALQQRLRSRGLSAYIVEAEIEGRGVYHRVRLGRFPTREEAKRYLEDLHRETQLDGFVVEAEG